MSNRSKNKGFTLAEMLIVVAIIGVLVSITAVTISNTLEKAREATDLANIRSAISKIQEAYLTDTGVDPKFTGKFDNKYDDIKETGMTSVLRSKKRWCILVSNVCCINSKEVWMAK